MERLKSNTSFVILVFVNLLLFALYLESAKYLVLLDNSFVNSIGKSNFILIHIVLVFLVMWMLSSRKKVDDISESKTVSQFKFKNYDIEVEILLADMYDLFKKRPEVNYADVYFQEIKNGYGVDVELNVKDGTIIGNLTNQMQKEIKDVFLDKYGYDGHLEIQFSFKMLNESGKEEEIVPEEIKKEIEGLDHKEEKSLRKKNKKKQVEQKEEAVTNESDVQEEKGVEEVVDEVSEDTEENNNAQEPSVEDKEEEVVVHSEEEKSDEDEKATQENTDK